MFTLKTDAPNLYAELCDVIRLFSDEYDPAHIEVEFWQDCSGNGGIGGAGHTLAQPKRPLSARKIYARAAKNALYQALKSYFHRDMPWGSLTGIRPSKLVYDYLAEGFLAADIPGELRRDFFVSSPKAALITEIVQNQRGHFSRDPNDVNLYIHIPFCPSRCNYCSFVSVPIEKQRRLVAPYVEKLCAEITAAKELIRKTGRKIYSAYIGGGTPTVLCDEHFSRILETIEIESLASFHKPLSALEFTCEAGRPETFTPEKLAIMKRCGVTRVSVNPQSLNGKTLLAVGRNHMERDFFEAYERTAAAGFKINVDIIAGLACETPADFSRTLEKVAALRPHNVTVHTLSRKRGSALKEQSVKEFAGGAAQMTDFARERLTAQGYLPYYLYRQKQMLENLENVGYCLPGCQCANNITVMEEMLSVLACGAGAISKLVLPAENRIERLANIKDVKLYLERFNGQLSKKEDFFNRSHANSIDY